MGLVAALVAAQAGAQPADVAKAADTQAEPQPGTPAPAPAATAPGEAAPAPATTAPTPAPAATAPAATAPAATAPAATASSPAQDLSGSLEEILALESLLNAEATVATKSVDSVLAAPSSITVFTGDEIRNMGVTTLEELLNFVPGFQATRDAEQGSAFRLGVRGRSKFNSEFVLFLMDGQRLNDLYTGGVTLLNRRIAVENIKQVEIIRGPGSALYGSNAFLGVVNIVTLEGVNGAKLSAGNMNSRSAALNVSHTFGEVSASAFAGAFVDDGYYYPGETDAFGIVGDAFDPSQGFDVSSTVRYRGLTVHLRHMERQMRDWLAFGVLQSNSAKDTTQQSSINARYELELSDRMSIDFTAGYSQDRWREVALVIPAGVEFAPGATLDQSYYCGPLLRSYSAGVGVDFAYQVHETNRFLLGASYDQAGISEVKNIGSHDPVTLEYLGGIRELSGDKSFNEVKSRQILGLYAQDRQRLFEHLDLIAGVRLDVYDDFGSSINPRAAIVYETPISSHVKALYGRAFRAPSFLELYDKNNPVDFGNHDLEPEQVQTFEVAYAQGLKKLNATATYFNNSISNVIDYGEPLEDPNNPLGARTFYNMPGAQLSSGLEVELAASVMKGLLVRAAFTHYFNADELPMPANTAALVVNWHWERLNVNVSAVVRQKMVLLPDQDSYVIANAAAAYEVLPHFRVTGQVANLTDTAYRSITVPLERGAPNRGRTFMLGMAYEL